MQGAPYATCAPSPLPCATCHLPPHTLCPPPCCMHPIHRLYPAPCAPHAQHAPRAARTLCPPSGVHPMPYAPCAPHPVPVPSAAWGAPSTLHAPTALPTRGSLLSPRAAHAGGSGLVAPCRARGHVPAAAVLQGRTPTPPLPKAGGTGPGRHAGNRLRLRHRLGGLSLGQALVPVAGPGTPVLRCGTGSGTSRLPRHGIAQGWPGALPASRQPCGQLPVPAACQAAFIITTAALAAGDHRAGPEPPFPQPPGFVIPGSTQNWRLPVAGPGDPERGRPRCLRQTPAAAAPLASQQPEVGPWGCGVAPLPVLLLRRRSPLVRGDHGAGSGWTPVLRQRGWQLVPGAGSVRQRGWQRVSQAAPGLLLPLPAATTSHRPPAPATTMAEASQQGPGRGSHGAVAVATALPPGSHLVQAWGASRVGSGHPPHTHREAVAGRGPPRPA